MNADKSKISIFIDDNKQPISDVFAPVQFELDTRKLTDGEHQLKLVSKSPTGREGIQNSSSREVKHHKVYPVGCGYY